MTDVLLIVALVLLTLNLLLVVLLVGRTRPRSAEPADRTPELLGQLAALGQLTGNQLGQLKQDLASQRDELGNALGRGQQVQSQALEQVSAGLERRLSSFADSQTQLANGLRQEQTNARTQLTQSLQQLSESLTKSALEQRAEDRKAAEALTLLVRDRLAEMATGLGKLAESMRQDAEANRKTLEERLAGLQASNEQRLEQMRHTVDEKLQATLEARLGASFQLVSTQLEAVQKGLGEMRALADGVGDLKRVMTNVKTRGTWGEVQLLALVEDILRPEEYVTNWAPAGRTERVELAIRLPGTESDQPIYLPVDSKFPAEDYQRLLDAQDSADPEAAKLHGKALEDRVRACARDIATKYVVVNQTTDFALLFLPSEGLYAEVLRRPGLVERVQREHHVTLCGPTTLAALLTSLRMGFRAVAIQKRSGDIGALLSAVKTEFGKFGGVLDSVGNRLRQAQEELDKVQVRSRVIARKLTSVAAAPQQDAERLLPAISADVEDDAGA